VPPPLKKVAWLAATLGIIFFAITLIARQSFAPPRLSNRAASSEVGPLRVFPPNPRYFTNDGVHVVFLAGSHTWANLQDEGDVSPPPPFDYDAYIAFMVSHKMNFMRLWITNFSNDGGTIANYTGPVWPWKRIGPGTANDGNLRTDFTQLDQNYFDRLRVRIMQAGQNGIYVCIMLFDGFEYQFDVNVTDGNPYESGNNINGVNCPNSCPTDNSQMSSKVWGYQQAYIRKVIDTVNDLNNVLYEVSNESGSPYSDAWQASVIRYVKKYEAAQPKQHPVGMTFQYQGGSDTTLYRSEADWISPGTKLPPEANVHRVVINDTDHSYSWNKMKADGQDAQREWTWENFTRGNNLAFMDPYLVLWPERNAPSGAKVDPYWDVIRNALTDVRNYATKIDLANMTPEGSLSTSGFCLANPGSQYLVFGTSNSFTLTTVAGTYTFEWFNPSTHTIVQTGRVEVASSQTFTAPFGGDSVLWLHK
jgi:hypothetical protein